MHMSKLIEQFPQLLRKANLFTLAISQINQQVGTRGCSGSALTFLNKAVTPVLVGGPKLRVSKAGDAFAELADASGYAMAVMPAVKGLGVGFHLLPFAPYSVW